VCVPCHMRRDGGRPAPGDTGLHQFRHLGDAKHVEGLALADPAEPEGALCVCVCCVCLMMVMMMRVCGFLMIVCMCVCDDECVDVLMIVV